MASRSPEQQIDLAVIGSLNVDYVVEVPHRPDAGETVVGGDVQLLPGGKGANQAVAARAAGGEVAMVGCIGADPDGELIRGALARRGVDVSHVDTLDYARTGNAYILLPPDG
jgi:ribokinase